MKKSTGCVADYSVYRMSLVEKGVGAGIGFAVGFIVCTVFFEVAVVSVAAGIAAAAISVPAYRKYLKKRRMKRLLIQFRDFLESLSNSLSAGQNISMAISSSYGDMCMQYGEKSLIANEISAIISGMKNGNTAEELFISFAKRSGQQDIGSFADTFQICNRMGGNMKKIISETTEILTEKMRMESEIEAAASGGKNELLLMTGIPLIIVPMLKNLSDSGISGNTPITIIVRIAGTIMIGAAYLIGRRISDIKI